MKKAKKILAFTLAEVLITLAIIGVVAAMTIPILMQNYQKGQQLTAFKKMYSQLSEAVDKVMNDENVDDFENVSLLNGASADPKAFFKKYFRVSKYCAPADATSCFTGDGVSIDNSDGLSPTNWDCVTLKDGASICVIPNVDNNHWVNVLVDTNGFDKPNIGGRDLFKLHIYHDGSIDEVNPENLALGAGARDGRKDVCGSLAYGGGCFSKIIDAGWKMDY